MGTKVKLFRVLFNSNGVLFSELRITMMVIRKLNLASGRFEKILSIYFVFFVNYFLISDKNLAKLSETFGFFSKQKINYTLNQLQIIKVIKNYKINYIIIYNIYI